MNTKEKVSNGSPEPDLLSDFLQPAINNREIKPKTKKLHFFKRMMVSF
jgi:hypothetical protein